MPPRDEIRQAEWRSKRKKRRRRRQRREMMAIVKEIWDGTFGAVKAGRETYI